MASVTYDDQAKAFYVKIRSGKITQTEPLSDSVILDLNEKGELLGMEVILPKDLPDETSKKLQFAASYVK